MIRRRLVVLGIAAAWIAAACGQGAATPTATEPADPVALSPSPQPVPTVGVTRSEAPEITLEPASVPPSAAATETAAVRPSPLVLTSITAPDTADAWDQAAELLGRDGTIPLEAALQAFAVAVGPLPGVELPPGELPAISSASEATRWLIGRWAELTPEQQAAAAELLRLPSAGASGQPDVASLIAAAPPAPACASEASDAKITELRTKLDEVQPQIAEKVKRDLGIPVVFTLGDVQGRPGIAANTVPLDANCQPAQGRPALCQIQVTNRGQGLTGFAFTHLVAHELFHCFQYDFASSAQAAGRVPAWLAEGSAAWVGEVISFGSTLGEEYWERWLKEPLTPLFEQTYGGIGFFMHLQESGIDPWPLLMKMHQKGESSSVDAYAVATKGKGAAKMIDAWGPSFVRDLALRPDWSTSGPGMPEYVTTPVPKEPLADDGLSYILAVPPQAGYAAKFDVAADVLVFKGKTARGMVRLADGTQWDIAEVLGKPICLEGTCSCPGGSAGAGHDWLKGQKGEILVGVSGHTDGATVEVAGYDVKTTCDFPPFEFQPEQPCWCPPGPLGLSSLIADRARSRY